MKRVFFLKYQCIGLRSAGRGKHMKIFVYNMREFDELAFFKKYAEEYGAELGYTTEFPGPDNWHYADGYDGVSILTTPTEPEMIDRLKEGGVKVISTRTIGYDHVDIKYAQKADIGVTNVTYDPESVADYTIMMMLIACRKLPFIMNKASVQDYTLQGKIGKSISKCTIGVIGTGRIGKMVIEHLSGFGCRILAYDIYPSESVREHAEYVDLDTLYHESDIITLHAPALDSNYHMIDETAFAQMKDGVILINCARGQLVDTDAMIRNLVNGKIGFAALDVIENELEIYYKNLAGTIIDNPEMAVLKSFHNVFFSPHMAFYTEEAVADMVENSIIGIKSYLEGKDHPFIVTR